MKSYRTILLVIFFIFVSQSCRFVAPGPQCPKNQYFSSLICNCVPNNCNYSLYVNPCPKGKHFKSDTCQCQCLQRKNCTIGQTWSNVTCSCICDNIYFIKCQDYNQQSCKCHCLPPKNGCPQGQYYNNTQCKCLCSPPKNGCSSHRIWNQEMCKCLNPICKLPKQWDQQAKSCECLNKKQLKCDYGYNEEKCKCFEEPQCKRPKQWNPKLRLCDCPDKFISKCFPFKICEQSCLCDNLLILRNLNHHF